MDLSAEETRELNERLDREWDVDRRLHLVYGGGVLVGLILGRRNRRALMLSAAMGGCAVLAALLDWSPLKAVMQRLGVRTRKQIERERYVTIFGKEPPFPDD
ncbi:MAG: hypothetical protein ACYC3S_06610 [Chloroflexota bacterium]